MGRDGETVASLEEGGRPDCHSGPCCIGCQAECDEVAPWVRKLTSCLVRASGGGVPGTEPGSLLLVEPPDTSTSEV